MALTRIVNIVQSLSKESLAQGTDNPQAAQLAASTSSSRLSALIQDSFTPSNQTSSTQGAAQEAGLFQVSPLALAALEAGSLALQAAQPQASATPSPEQNAPPAPANPGATLPSATVDLNAPAAAQPSPAPVQTVSVVNTPSQILAFNQALAALGLNNNDIEKLDQIATLVNLFSPTAFNDLIRQFQALAQQAAQLSAVNASGTSTSNAGAYQVQALSLQFNKPQTSSNAATLASAIGGLQLGTVQFTLANSSGQPASVQAPQKPAAV
jgi:hypothetical protein